MRASRSRSQYALRWERGRPARNPDHARKKPTPLSPVHGGGWEGGMLKNQRKDTYNAGTYWFEYWFKIDI